MVGRDDVIREARALAALRGIAGRDLDDTLAALAPHLSAYAELVVAADGIEIITGGVGARVAIDLAKIAAACGGLQAASDAFLGCANAFSSRMLGLKVCFGRPRATPTLYVRTLAPRAAVMAFLETLPSFAPALGALEAALADNRIVYGLGFTSHRGEIALKTYTVADVTTLGSDEGPGFVSYRIVGGELTREMKRYVPDLAWNELPTSSSAFDMTRIRACVACDRVGHFGVVEAEGRAPEVKLYLERIGAIPSDFAAR